MSQSKLLCFIFLLSILGCVKHQMMEDPPFSAAQLAYYPLKLGHYVEYRVDSLVFDPTAPNGILRDSSSTFVKEIIADTLFDNTGGLLYLIERYERAVATEPWKLRFVCTASNTNGQAVRTEQNFRFLKMLFPMDRRSTWDGNLWIDDNREIENRWRTDAPRLATGNTRWIPSIFPLLWGLLHSILRW